MEYDDSKTNIEELLYSYYVKYSSLTPIIDSAFADCSSNVVNIYIDLYDYLRATYGKEVYSNKKFVVVSCIINMVAHYRNFFRTRYGVATNIYLIYADESAMNHKQFIPAFGHYDYSDTVSYRVTSEFVLSQLELVKILAAYITNVYFIKKKCNFAVFAYSEVSKCPSMPCILITKSQYAYQVPIMASNSIVIRPKKYAGEDTSYVVYRENAILQCFPKLYGEKNLENMMTINPELLSVLMTMNGLQDYGIYMVCNATQALKMVRDAVDSQRIINGYNNDINYVYDNLYGIDRYIDKTNFRFRFSAVDLIFQYRIYVNTPEAIDTSWLIDLYDPKAVQEINDKYFINNPLDLEVL